MESETDRRKALLEEALKQAKLRKRLFAGEGRHTGMSLSQLVEDELRCKLQRIVQFACPLDGQIEGHEASSVEKVIEFIQEHSRLREELQCLHEKEIEMIKSKHEHLIESHRKLSSLFFLKEGETRSTFEQERSQSLVLSVQVLSLMIRKLKLEILRKTYLIPQHDPLRGIKALQVIEEYINERKVQLKSLMDLKQRSLEEYQGLGEPFLQICNSYKHTCARIEELKDWIRQIL